MTTKKVKNRKSPLDGIKIRPVTKEEVAKLLEEGKKAADAFWNPPPPGEYVIGFSKRGKKTEHKCSSCSGQIEAIYEIIMPQPAIYGPGGKGHWNLTSHRCSSCKLVYDFS